MREWAELEIALDRRDDGYAVDLRFSQPNDDGDTRLLHGTPTLAQFDLAALRASTLDAATYGRLLGRGLFADPVVYDAFCKARDIAQSHDAPLRIRLFIHPSAPELNSLHWETLRDPRDDVPLFTSQNVLFSRYLSSASWRRVELRAQGDLRALVVIANPRDITQWQSSAGKLSPVNVAEELARARAGLEGIEVTELTSVGKATLQGLSEHLDDGYDILYLVCHGAFDKEQKAILYLEDESGNVQVVLGRDLLTRLEELPKLPRLVVLASCQSAGTGAMPAEGTSVDGGALAALGPKLVEVGVPAVVAMQGNVTMRTVELFMPLFFRELLKRGQIDLAMGVARGVVRDRLDAWMPVLFMRLKSGRIAYKPGFGGDKQDSFSKWDAVLTNIEAQSCTPILGPGVSEVVLGRQRDLARQWAEFRHFPFSTPERQNLPQVAQYVSITQNAMLLRTEFARYMQQSILHRYKGLPKVWQDAPLLELIKEVGKQERERHPLEPHTVLASLPLPIFITANQDDLLLDALTAAGKTPTAEICRWRTWRGMPSLVVDEDYTPTSERPLVFYLFGRLREPQSLVLTEDNFLDYIVGIMKNKDAIPLLVRGVLVHSALLLLGFRTEDWSFRALFRGVMRQEGRALLEGEEYTHVAAQVDPEGDATLEPESVRRYLEGYFQQDQISTYWGSVEDFVQDLHRVRARQQSAVAWHS